MFLQEVDLVQTEGKLLLPIEHLLLKFLESHCRYLGADPTRVIEQLLQLPPLELLLSLRDTEAVEIPELAVKFSKGSFIVSLF